MSRSPIRFGTDGWRGIVSKDVTHESVARVAHALGIYLERKGTAQLGVAVGYDRRLLSPDHAALMARVLSSMGIPVLLPGRYLPTPVLSWAVREHGLAAGVMVTASHNPPEYGGIKIKEPYGGPSLTETNTAIEAILDELEDGNEPDYNPSPRKDLINPLDPWEAYLDDLRKLVDFDRAGRAGSCVFDAMHGCGAGWTDRVLTLAGVATTTLRGEYNPGFGGVGPEPVPDRLGKLMERVTATGARFGVANDGDGDRIAGVDERGRFFSPQRILAVLAKYLIEEKGFGGDIVKTVSATSMLDGIAREHGRQIIETPIGFRHAGKLINDQPILIAGEESGAVGIGAHLPERDGVAAALLLAELIGSTGKGLRDYLESVFQLTGHFVYGRVDLKLSAGEIAEARKRFADFSPPDNLCGMDVEHFNELDGIKLTRTDLSWLLMRTSGTEPLVRIYAEAADEEQLEELLKEGQKLAGIRG